uniref:Mediator of RNA polymerase II transcription subunit 11 n=1 Tax=Anthurium amnicola TaxID=1678845 RepID=A0A1D1XQD5_9ARAE
MNQNENTRNIGHLSAERIRDLEVTEKLIVDLLDTAAKAIMGLALDGHVNNNDEETSKMELTVKKRSPEEQIKIFQDLTKKFNDLIEEIQLRLRLQFRQMRNMGITSGDIPLRTVTYGEAKEYETWMNAAKILRKELEKIMDIGAAAGGLQDMKNDNMEIDEQEDWKI